MRAGKSFAAVIFVQTALILVLLHEHRRRRQAEVQSRQRLLELTHMNRYATAGELSASIAHELYQPLGTILSNTEAAELFLNSPTPNLDKIKEILADIKRDDERASKIIHRLRSLLTKKTPKVCDIDVNVAVGEVLEFLSPQATARKIVLASFLVPHLPPIVGDRIQLQQVILNLVLNGMEATRSEDKSGGRRVTVTTALSHDATVEVSIADSGSGIPTDKLIDIFKPFYTTKEHGMGLGLSIARTIVEAHRGRIWAENTNGGAVFRISLPLPKQTK